MRGLLVLVLFAVLTFSACQGGEDSTGTTSQVLITSVTPTSVSPGQEGVEGRIFGQRFVGVSSVNLGDGIHVQNFSALSASEIYVFFSVSRDAAPGPRNVTVITTSGSAQSPSALQVGTNLAPTADFDVSPNKGFLTTEFRFDASRSRDDAGIVEYKWNFGDGKTETGKVVTHKFRVTGVYFVELTVKDGSSLTSKKSRTLDVDGSKPPIAKFTTEPEAGDTETVFKFDASSSRDPDGKISVYSWSFGDGTIAHGVKVEHKYAEPGGMPVTLTVSDNTGEFNFLHRVLRVDKKDGGGGGGGGGGDSEKCTQPARGRVAYLFRVLEADLASRTLIAEFLDDVSCRNVFYLCGDVRLGGYNGAPGKEYWIGSICAMESLGDNKFAIHLVEGNSWVDVGETGTYVWPQFDCNPSIHCSAFGY